MQWHVPPDPAHPALSSGAPHAVGFERVCGHRWQEAFVSESSPPCFVCGIFSIGCCQDCGKPVCGNRGHSEVVGLKLRCAEHAASARASERARAQEVVAAEILDAWMHRLGRLTNGLHQVDDHEARAVAAWVLRRRLFADPPRLAGRPTQQLDDLSRDRRAELLDRYRAALATSFTSLFEGVSSVRPFAQLSGDPADWELDPGDLLRWLEAHLPPDRIIDVTSDRRGFPLMRRRVDERVGGWALAETVTHSGQDYMHTVSRSKAYAVTLGFVVSLPDGSSRWPTSGGRRELNDDDIDVLYARLNIEVPGAPMQWRAS